MTTLDKYLEQVKKYSGQELQDILTFHLLKDRDDVVFTPHNAFNSKEAIERIVTKTVENIQEFCSGK